MGSIDPTKSNIQEQIKKSQNQFESQLIRLELGKEQIQNQTLPELEQSLERVNDALQHPNSFGVSELKIGTSVFGLGFESNYEMGVVPLLLERKKFILDRIRELKGEQKIENLHEEIKNVPESKLRVKLEKQIEEQKA